MAVEGVDVRREWSPRDIQVFTELWNSGMKAVEIGERFGVSKSAITGKAGRLGLEMRIKPGERKVLPSKPRHRKWATGDGASHRASLPSRAAPHQVVLSRTKKCLWPMWNFGERATHVYCDDPAIEGTSYCPHHYRMSRGPGVLAPKEEAA